MKKLISLFISIVLCVCSTFALCSCGLLETNSDVAKANLEKLIDCLDKNDNNGIKALFASNKIADIPNFDEDVSELLELYKGSFVSHNFDTPATEDDIHNNNKKKWFIIGADIITTQERYHATIYWCDMDTSDKGNVGIWSLYFFNIKDNPLEDYSFYGDSSWDDENVKGIYVVKPYKYIDMTMNILQSGNIENVKTLFAPNVVKNYSAFNESVDSFFSYYSAKYTACTEVALDTDIQLDADGNMTKRFRMFSYSIDTDSGKYSIAVRYCDKDTEDSNNLGVHSIYIRQGENSVDTPFCGDLMWYEGINIENI